MEEFEIIAACGDKCSICPRYVATKENSTESLEYIAELWFKLGFRDIIAEPEEIKCYGCSKDNNCMYKINSCPNLETINNCGECKSFVCSKLQQAFNNSEINRENTKATCTPDEYEVLHKAFFQKKEVLEKVNHNTFSKNKNNSSNIQ